MLTTTGVAGRKDKRISPFIPTPASIMQLLPVWFANLDCGSFPTPDEIARAQVSDEKLDAVSGALLSLQMIPMLRNAPPGVYPEFWARAWPWLDFLHMHREHLVGLPTEKVLYATFMRVLVHFQTSHSSKLASTTPGVRTVALCAWDISLEHRDPNALSNLSTFLYTDVSQGEDESCIDEYIEAPGGGVEHLASLIARHLDLAIVDSKLPMARHNFNHFTAALVILARIGSSKKFAAPCRRAMIRRGAVRTLVAGLCSRSLASAHREGLGMLAIATSLAANYTTMDASRIPLSHALQAGLLHALVLVAALPLRQDELTHVIFFLKDVLPASLVYRSVLLQMPGLFVELYSPVKAAAFIASPVFAEWQRFHALLQERLTFLTSLDVTPYVLHKACDNMTCGQTHPKSNLRRCSTCLELYYCSEKCQTADWRERHRNVCHTFSGFRRLAEEEQCNVKDRTFLRALLRRDYFSHRRVIYAQQIAHRVQNPSQLFYVFFDYLRGPVSVAVRSWPTGPTDVLAHPDDWVERFNDHAWHSSHSDDLLEVHVMAIHDGSKPYWKIVPMRHTSPDIRDKLRSIVSQVAAIPATEARFTDAVAMELPSLLEMEPQIIHE
ncbi:hypothetical protein C8R47DRAFT_129682 [Mycena vitilis]|nr:hypothetical protein C8R47DRAFT_129682 [Mycena vitilis]